MTFLPGDYAIGGITAGLAILGLFRGFSGILAFLVASVASAAVGVFGWGLAATYLPNPWARGVAILVAGLLTFCLVRVVVKKSVNGCLAQPSDAFFGLAVGVATGVLLLVAWAYTGYYTEYSTLATEVIAPYVR